VRLEEFKAHIEHAGGRYKDRNNSNLKWEYQFQLAEFTKYMEFNCEFDAKGRCWNSVSYKPPTTKDINYFKYLYSKKPKEFKRQYRWWSARNRLNTRIMCCCSSCHRTVGWAYYFPKDDKILRRMARYFNDLTGFWRPEKGCVLPRKYRSPTCVTYACRRSEVRPQWLHRFLRHALHEPSKRLCETWAEQSGEYCNTIPEVITSIKNRLRKEGRCTRKE